MLIDKDLSRLFHLSMSVGVRLLVTGMVASLLLVSCGGDSDSSSGGDDPAREDSGTSTTSGTVATTEAPTPAAAEDIAVCDLVSAGEMSDAIGSTVTAEPDLPTPPFFSCSYRSADGLATASISVISYEDRAAAEAGYQVAIDTNDYPELTDIGDRAYNSQPIGDVTALSGRYEISISLNPAGEPNEEAELEAAARLARLAIGRLDS